MSLHCLFRKHADVKVLPYSMVSDYDKNELYHQLTLASQKHEPLTTNQEERNLIKNIKLRTKLLNVNNITRTNAYLNFYLANEDVHWALLAHMVSRNGGWSMTDLKSDIISPFLQNHQQTTLFHFLERANALIFHDAYPQLLLYEESKTRKKPLFDLLLAFNVSKFMKPIWKHFFQYRDSHILTNALITNEQNYLEKNLMNSDGTKKHILNSLSFMIQEKLGLTNVFFPHQKIFFQPIHSLAGVEIQNFSEVSARIHVGKTLYDILFFQQLYERILDFAERNTHTASRSDYWPHLFSTNMTNKKIYSPTLYSAWEDVEHIFTKNDWFTSFDQVKGFEQMVKVNSVDVTKDVKFDLLKLVSLVKMKQQIML
ncbi:DUF2515 family protein [Metabacillus herbersteinensis]|uniref:DUF2515 family protein n=2 Tax=Metabacillus herbersteinensis TaxID=283816 RepID=A0ABV6GKU5_9BACI